MKKIFKITCSSEMWDEVIGYITLNVKDDYALCNGKEYQLVGNAFFRTYNNNILKYEIVKRYGG